MKKIFICLFLSGVLWFCNINLSLSDHNGLSASEIGHPTYISFDFAQCVYFQFISTPAYAMPTFEYTVFAVIPSSLPIFPESALITSCGASIATLMICTFRSRYGRPIRPIIYEPYSCKSLFSSGVESIFSTMIPIKATLVSIRFLPDYQIYMIFIHESMIQILE